MKNTSSPDLKDSLYGLLLQGLALYAKVQFRAARVFVRCQRRSRIAVMEPSATSFASLGDQALLGGACRFVAERTEQVPEVLTYFDDEVFVPQNARHGGALYRRDAGFIGKLSGFLKWPGLFARYSDVYVIGADMIDGYYSPARTIFIMRILHLATSAGAKAHLVSCSFNSTPHPQVIARAQGLLAGVRINCRDVHSAKRLEKLAGVAATSSADVAFGLRPVATARTASIARWISGEQQQTRRVVALNINMLPVRRESPGKETDYLRSWSSWLASLEAEALSFVLVSHDNRGEWSDLVALEKIRDMAPVAMAGRLMLPEEQLDAAEVKHLTSLCDLCVTGRMHLAIAALGSAVPVIGYAYQGKFEGIFNLFDAAGNVRSVRGMLDDPDTERVFVLDFIQRLAVERDKLRSHQQQVLELAGMNIAKA